MDKSLWSPGDKAAYSDLAYILLGYALENITGKPYETIVRDKIVQPLGLNSTGFDRPPASQAIIPIGMDFFSLDFGNYNAYETLKSEVIGTNELTLWD
jgi:CubicO group peptidase (beta-lactamase class C family)